MRYSTSRTTPQLYQAYSLLSNQPGVAKVEQERGHLHWKLNIFMYSSVQSKSVLLGVDVDVGDEVVGPR